MCVCVGVCECVCVGDNRGKGGGQVNELVIRIDVASAVGFPSLHQHSLSLWSSVHPLNSPSHTHCTPPLPVSPWALPL